MCSVQNSGEGADKSRPTDRMTTARSCSITGHATVDRHGHSVFSASLATEEHVLFLCAHACLLMSVSCVYVRMHLLCQSQTKTSTAEAH